MGERKMVCRTYSFLFFLNNRMIFSVRFVRELAVVETQEKKDIDTKLQSEATTKEKIQ